MKSSRLVLKIIVGLLLLGVILTMSESYPRREYRLVNVGGMGSSCQCTSRIEQ